MSNKTITLKDRLLAAAVIFGGEGEVAEIEFRQAAYRVLLKLALRAGDGTVDEFDIISALEDLPSFKPREKLRQLANDLKLFERGADGTMRLKEHVHLDDYRPGAYPFAAPASVPVDFGEEREAEAGGFKEFLHEDFSEILRTTVHGLSALFGALEASKSKNIFAPFYRSIGGESTKAVKIEEIGAKAATSPILDIVLFLSDMGQLQAPGVKASIAESWERLYGWLTNLATCRLPANDPFGDGGALFLRDDDDYPGADRPSVFSNAEMLSATFKVDSVFPEAGFAAFRTPLLEFVLACQNEDGGWGPYRYRSDLYSGKPTIAPSLPFFSFIAFAGLVDVFFDGDGTATDRIAAAFDRYAGLLVQSAQTVDDSTGWSETFSSNDPISLFDTALNLRACLLLSKILARRDGKLREQAGTLRELAKKAVHYVCAHWVVSSAANPNIQKIVWRVPTTQGSAGTPMMWEQPGDARILRALSEASLAGITPGIDGCVKMAHAATEIAKACRKGFWMDLDASNTRDGIFNINVTITSATGLLFFERARRALVASPD